MMRCIALVLLVPSVAAADGTEWLPGGARAISRSLSASRDAPVVEYAFGPRAQASVGGDLALVALHRSRSIVRLGGSLLFAFENAESRGPAPYELWRFVGELSASCSLERFAMRHLGPRGRAELSFSLGRAAAMETPDRLDRVPEPDEIPFGGGGYYLKPELGIRLAPAERFELDVRFDYRLFLNVLPRLVGHDDVSNAIANGLKEGLAHAPALNLTLRWTPRPHLLPFVSAHAAYLTPHDDHARGGYFCRLLAGIGVAAGVGRVSPFASVDIGNGLGLLIYRRELRFSLGVRYAWS